VQNSVDNAVGTGLAAIQEAELFTNQSRLYLSYQQTATLVDSLSRVERDLMNTVLGLSTERRRLLNSIRLDIIEELVRRQGTLFVD